TGIAVGTKVTVTFSESIQPGTLSLILKDAANNTVAASVTYNDVTHTATLTPAASLVYSSAFPATLSGAQDLAGNPMAGSVTWRLTTEAARDIKPPTATANPPSANATGIAIDTAFTVTFSDSIQPGTLSFLLKDASNNPVAATVTYNDATHTATLSPGSSLS